MIIQRMVFMNYKKFKEPTELDLSEFCGRIGILGNNGSGKSSLLDVIPISLYGVDAITGKKEHLRTQGLDKDSVSMRLEFEHDGKFFIIEREFKGINLTAKTSLFQIINGVTTLLATGVKEVNAYITKILNMDYATFIATVFCKQKELSRISTMQPVERKALILKLSGVDDIDSNIKKTREFRRDNEKLSNMLVGDIQQKDLIVAQLSALDDEVKAMRTESKSALSKIEASEKAYLMAKDNKCKYDEKYEKYNELALLVKDCKNKMSNNDADIERFVKERDLLSNMKLSLDIDGYPFISEFEKLCAKIDELDKIRPLYLEKQQLEQRDITLKNELLKLKSEGTALSKNILDLDFSSETLNDLSSKISATSENIDSFKNKLSVVSSKSLSLKDKISVAKKELDVIDSIRNGSNDGSDCKCPMCKQRVDDSYFEIVKAHYEKEIECLDIEYKRFLCEEDAIKSNLKELSESIVDLQDKFKKESLKEKQYLSLVAKRDSSREVYSSKTSEYQAVLDNLKALKDVSFDEAEYLSLKNTKTKNESKLKSIHIAIDKVNTLPTVIESISSLMLVKKSLSEEYSDIVAKGKALAFNKEEFLSIKAQFDVSHKKYLDVKEETSILTASIHAKDVVERNVLKSRLKELQKKEKEYEKTNQLVKDYIIIEEALIKAKSEIMGKINPLINKHFSEIFKTLLNDKYEDVELDENYQILIYDCGEGFPLSRFSGGEQDMCNLALRLAISKFLTEMNNGSIEFVVLDEIFASLDDDRKTSLIDVLGRLNSFFKQIFVISHEDVIKSGLDYYLTVKENGSRFSEIEY